VRGHMPASSGGMKWPPPEAPKHYARRIAPDVRACQARLGAVTSKLADVGCIPCLKVLLERNPERQDVADALAKLLAKV